MLSSFKSQIGHCLGASGINNLVRGVMAMQNGIFPPTLNYHTPDSEIDMERCGLPCNPPTGELASDRQISPGGCRSMPSGSAALISWCTWKNVLTAPGWCWSRTPRAPRPGRKCRKSRLHRPLIEGVSFLRTRIADLPHRLGVVAEDDKEAREKVAALDPLTAPLTDKTLRGLAGQGIFAAPEADPPAPVALVFAGQGTYYPGMGRNLYQTFPLVRQWMERLAAEADFDLLDLMFNSQDEDLQKTRWQQPALFTLEYAMVQPASRPGGEAGGHGRTQHGRNPGPVRGRGLFLGRRLPHHQQAGPVHGQGRGAESGPRGHDRRGRARGGLAAEAGAAP